MDDLNKLDNHMDKNRIDQSAKIGQVDFISAVQMLEPIINKHSQKLHSVGRKTASQLILNAWATIMRGY